MTREEYSLHQKVKLWNIVASAFFMILCVVLYFAFAKIDVESLSISLFDIIIIALANHRLVRLFVYDNLTLFIREFFMDLKVVGVDDQKSYEYVKSNNSFKLTIYKLLTCPWCFGVWTVFVSSFFYFNFFEFKIIFVLLAISSLASFLIIFTNFLGWSAEAKKNSVEKI
jgi:hypothetical protein